MYSQSEDTDEAAERRENTDLDLLKPVATALHTRELKAQRRQPDITIQRVPFLSLLPLLGSLKPTPYGVPTASEECCLF